MKYKISAIIAVTMYFAILVIRMLAKPELLVSWPVFDDSFYAFSVASNIGRGHGVTIDGSHLTNGFQPLWVFIISPLWTILPGKFLAIRFVYLFSFIVHMLIWFFSRKLIIKLLKRSLPVSSELVLFILLFSSYTVFSHIYNGLETGLIMLAFVLIILALEKYGRCPQFSNSLIIGFALAFGILSRIDFGFASIGVAVSMILLATNKGVSSLRKTIHIASAVFVSFVLTLPWWLYNFFKFNHLLPSSARAQMGASDIIGNITSTIVALNSNLFHSKFLTMHIAPILGTASNSTLICFHCIVLITVLYSVRIHLSAVLQDNAGRILVPLLISQCFLAIYYMLFFWAAHMFDRYCAGFCALSFIIWPLAAANFSSQYKAKKSGILFAIVLGAIIILNSGMIVLTVLGKGIGRNRMYTEQLALVNSKLSDSMVVSAGQSGTLGYFRPSGTVVNMDGKVDQRIQLVRENRQSVTNYLTSQGIYYFVDWPSYMCSIIPQEERDKWQLVSSLGDINLYQYSNDSTMKRSYNAGSFHDYGKVADTCNKSAPLNINAK